MPRVHPIISSLNGGELSPWLEGRVDFAQYPKGLRLCQNMLPTIQGPVIKRPATKYVADAKEAAKTCRLHEFIFSDSPGDAIILEFGDLYVRFFTNRGQIEDPPGTPVTVVTPYLEADLPRLRFAQSADVLYIAHPDYAPRKLVRTTNISWTLSVINFVGGPFLDEDTQGTTMTPADTGHITADMTGLTAPSGTASTSSGSASAWQMFDRERTQSITIDGSSSGYVQYQFDAAAQKVADAYWLTAHNTALNDGDYITEWEFQGSNDGATFVTLDQRSGETGWTNSETRFYSFPNSVAYEYYRLDFRGGGGSDATNSKMAELAIHQKASDQTAFNLVASSTTGINGTQGFLTTDVGHPIRLLGSDGVWRVAEIVTRTNSTTVTVTIDGHALVDISPISRWQMGAWSAETGFPFSVTLYNDRLFWGGSNTQPQTLWGSVVGDYENHAVGSEDDQAMNITLSSNDVQFVRWIIGDEKGLLVGTDQGEWIIRPSSLNEALTPTNIQASQVTDHGSSLVAPERISKAVLFYQRTGRKLREMAYLIEVDGFKAPDLTIRAEHITEPGILDMAYQSQPLSVLWSVRSDGVLLGFTYERDQEVTAWHRHTIGGTSDAAGTPAVVESVASIAAPTGDSDDVWMVVKRWINGAVVRHIEYMTPIFGHTDVKEDAFFVDSGLTYDGAPATVITGLDHLEGETVRVLVDGATHPDQVVASGQITIKQAASKVHVGLAYAGAIQTERIEAGTQDGTAQGRIKRINRVTFRIYMSGVFEYGYDPDDLYMIDARSSDDEMDEAPELITDDVREVFNAPHETDGTIYIKSDNALPLTILAIMPEIETSGP